MNMKQFYPGRRLYLDAAGNVVEATDPSRHSLLCSEHGGIPIATAISLGLVEGEKPARVMEEVSGVVIHAGARAVINGQTVLVKEAGIDGVTPVLGVTIIEQPEEPEQPEAQPEPESEPGSEGDPEAGAWHEGKSFPELSAIAKEIGVNPVGKSREALIQAVDEARAQG